MAATPGAARASAERTARMLRALEWLMIPLLVALGFMLASFAVRNSDFWMHLASGRLIAQGKYSIGVDPFSHASAGHYWVNSSWLYDFATYQLYNLTPNHSAVVIVKAGLVAFLALIIFLAGRPDSRERIALGSKADPSGWIAAILTGLALLAISPRVSMQPEVISFLFTAITLMVLRFSRQWPAWSLPATLAFLFALWANFDGWFFVGPVLVGLYLIGEIAQQLVPGSERSDRARIKNLAAAFALGLTACLLNPHHYHVFTVLPIELRSNVVRELQVDPTMQFLFWKPFGVVYLHGRGLGISPGGISYFTLLIISALSFGLTTFRPRLPLLLVWLACLGLSLYNWRLIPFFAVVAAPIAALNVQTFFARRPERKFKNASDAGSMPDPELTSAPIAKTAPASTGVATQPPPESWWPGATEPAPRDLNEAPMSDAEPQVSVKTSSGGVTVTPEGMLMFGSIMGRLFTIVGLLLLLAAAFPGWLHPTSAATAGDFRMSFDVLVNPAYQEFAEQLAQWRREGKLPPGAKGLPLQPRLGNYLAWFAPDEKGFLDYRFALLGGLSSDFVKVKKGLNELAKSVDSPTDYAEVLRRRGITHVIISDEDPTEFFTFLQVMFSNNREWSLWFQNGNVAIFGWHDVESQPNLPHDPLRKDLEAMAFGSDVQRLPSPATIGASRDLPPDPNLKKSFLDRYLAEPAPFPPTATDSALTYIDLRQAVMNQASRSAQDVLSDSILVGSIGRLGQLSGLPPQLNLLLSLYLPLSNQVRYTAVMRMVDRHPLPAACNLLAVREAQRGVLAQPNLGRSHLVLALAYQGLPRIGSQCRPWQQTIAARQALARLTSEQRNSRSLGQLVTLVLVSLIQEHKQLGQLDLALEASNEAISHYQLFPPAFLTDEQNTQQLTALKKDNETLQKVVTENREKFSIELDTLQRQNVPVHEQVALAFRLGLIREAKRLLDPATIKLDIPTMHELIAADLMLGVPEEAQIVLDQVPEQFRAEFRGEQIKVWIATGDYARAGSALEAGIARVDKNIDPKRKVLEFAGLCEWLLGATANQARQLGQISFVYGILAAEEAAANHFKEDLQRADMNASRAMLALEEGDLTAAEKYFKKANEFNVPYNGFQFAAVCLKAIEKQAAKTKR